MRCLRGTSDLIEMPTSSIVHSLLPAPCCLGSGAKYTFGKVVKQLGMPSDKKSAVFFNIVQKAFAPPPLLFEHLSYFAGGVF